MEFEQRIVGIDYGTRRLGFAVSDPTGIIATPLRVVEVSSCDEAVSSSAEVCSEQQASQIVVGMPFNMDGSRGPAAEAVESFIAELAKRTGLDVAAFDERLTTAMVERSLLAADASRAKRRKVRDKLAAQVILQGYLDSRAGYP